MENTNDRGGALAQASTGDNGEASEAARHAALQCYDVLEASSCEPLDRLTRLAASLFDVPIAVISFAGQEAAQVAASCIGLSRQQVCHEASSWFDITASEGGTVVENVTEDERFSDSPLVTTPPGVRFYAGVPLATPGGLYLGTLCVMGTAPRSFDAAEEARLRDLADTTMDVLERRHRGGGTRSQGRPALQQSEGCFRTLVERAAGVTTILEPDGTVRYQSASVKDVLGYAPRELEGSDPFSYVHPADRAHVRRLFSLILEEPGKTTQTEFRMRHVDSTWVDLEVSGRNLVEDPAVRGVVLHSRDVTERKKAELALRESEERHRALLSHASDVMTILEEDGTIRYESPSVEWVLGHDPAMLEGQNVFDWIHPDDRGSARAAFADLVNQPSTVSPVQFRMRHVNGTWVDLEALARNLLGNPAIEGIVVNSRDITDSLRFEAEREARKRAEELLEAKMSFLNSMSHELRTPLTSILGFADLLSEEGEQRERRQEEFAAHIAQSGKRLQKTLDSVLSLARLESGEGAESMELEVLDVAEEVRQAAASHRLAAGEQGLSFSVQIPATAIPAYLNAGALHRIMDNLLGNAAKFTQEGGITTSVEATPSEVHICVSDTGVGIGADFQAKLFEDFTQESSGLNRSHEGAGLGLSITRRLTEMMDGTIGVQSVQDEGTTFTVRFPRAASSSEDFSGDEVLPGASEGASAFPDLFERRLLVVEDNENTRVLASHILGESCQVTQAASPQEALALAKDAVERSSTAGEAPFDALLIDINLGASADGLELLRQLRALPAYAKVPAVAFTAHAMPGDEETLRGAGFEEYLPKPFSKEELLEATREAFSKGGS